jgi:DNA-directed RNA polymerase subunit RPC12/RpoP
LFFVPIFTTDDKNNKYKCTVCGGNLCFDIPDSYLGEIDGLSEIGLSGINFEEKQESTESPKASPSDKIVLKCKHCKKKIRIPRINKAILVTCPHCKTKFRVNQNPYNELDALIDLDNKLDSMLMGDKIKKNRLVSNYEKKFMTYSKIQIYQAIIDDIIRDNR